MPLHLLGQPGVVHVAQVDDVRLAAFRQRVGDLLGHVLGHGPRPGQPGTPVADHDEPRRAADRVLGGLRVERVVSLGQMDEHGFRDLDNPVRVLGAEVPPVQEALDEPDDLLPEPFGPGRLVRHAPRAQRGLHGALHQAHRRLPGQVGNRATRPAARGRLGLPGAGQRPAHLVHRVAGAGNHRRGLAHRITQRGIRQLPADGFHVLVDRVTVVRLPPHRPPPHPNIAAVTASPARYAKARPASPARTPSLHPDPRSTTQAPTISPPRTHPLPPRTHVRQDQMLDKSSNIAYYNKQCDRSSGLARRPDQLSAVRSGSPGAARRDCAADQAIPPRSRFRQHSCLRCHIRITVPRASPQRHPG